MKKSIKSYLVFTSLSYRIWGLVIVPLLLAGVTVFGVCVVKLRGAQLYMIASYVIVFEILSDYWLFGGICEKQTREMEYLKTSLRGIGMLKRGLIIDLLRRAVYLLLFSIFCFAGSGQMESFIMGAELYLVILIGLNISRYLTIIQQQLLVSMLAIFPMSLLGLLEGCLEDNFIRSTYMIGMELTILYIVAVVVSIITVQHAMSRVKGSYYEKGTE